MVEKEQRKSFEEGETAASFARISIHCVFAQLDGFDVSCGPPKKAPTLVSTDICACSEKGLIARTTHQTLANYL